MAYTQPVRVSPGGTPGSRTPRMSSAACACLSDIHPMSYSRRRRMSATIVDRRQSPVRQKLRRSAGMRRVPLVVGDLVLAVPDAAGVHGHVESEFVRPHLERRLRAARGLLATRSSRRCGRVPRPVPGCTSTRRACRGSRRSRWRREARCRCRRSASRPSSRGRVRRERSSIPHRRPRRELGRTQGRKRAPSRAGRRSAARARSSRRRSPMSTDPAAASSSASPSASARRSTCPGSSVHVVDSSSITTSIHSPGAIGAGGRPQPRHAGRPASSRGGGGRASRA